MQIKSTVTVSTILNVSIDVPEMSARSGVWWGGGCGSTEQIVLVYIIVSVSGTVHPAVTEIFLADVVISPGNISRGHTSRRRLPSNVLICVVTSGTFY